MGNRRIRSGPAVTSLGFTESAASAGWTKLHADAAVHEVCFSPLKIRAVCLLT
jgi:hypothetical protein